MDVTPVKKSNASDQVFEQLKRNLIQGTWKIGDRIPSENDLAAMFNVSRITIRQALSRLMALGLIETRFGEGSFVKEPSPGMCLQDLIPAIYLNTEFSSKGVRDILEFRLIYEGETAALAATRITKEDLARLKTMLRNMTAHQNDIARYAEEDLNFHSLIAEITGNSLVIQLSRVMRDILRAGIEELTENVGVENGLTNHGDLILAFEAGDAERARQVMNRHLRDLLVAFK